VLHAVGVVAARLEVFLAVPAVVQALGAVTGPVTDAVVEQVVARNVEPDG